MQFQVAIRRHVPTVVIIDGTYQSLASYKAGVYEDNRWSVALLGFTPPAKCQSDSRTSSHSTKCSSFIKYSRIAGARLTLDRF